MQLQSTEHDTRTPTPYQNVFKSLYSGHVFDKLCDFQHDRL